MLVLCTRDEAQGAQSGDSYEDGGFEPSKTKTVTKMATTRGSIPVIVDTFEALGRRWGIKNDDSYEDGDPQETLSL